MEPDKEYMAIHPHRLILDGDSSMFLKLTSPEDSEQLYQLVHENRAHLARYQRWAKDVDFEAMHAAVLGAVQQIKADSWLQYRIMVPSRDKDHEMVGTLTFYDHDVLAKSAKFGFWLAEAHQGKGYARRGAERLLRYGFGEWGLETVIMEIHEGNERSEGLATRLGARLTDQHVEEEADGVVVRRRVWVLTK